MIYPAKDGTMFFEERIKLRYEETQEAYNRCLVYTSTFPCHFYLFKIKDTKDFWNASFYVLKDRFPAYMKYFESNDVVLYQDFQGVWRVCDLTNFVQALNFTRDQIDTTRHFCPTKEQQEAYNHCLENHTSGKETDYEFYIFYSQDRKELELACQFVAGPDFKLNPLADGRIILVRGLGKLVWDSYTLNPFLKKQVDFACKMRADYAK